MAQQHNIRLLAAIMFADMVGYTKLMQEDEAQAKKQRDHQRKVVDDTILDRRGQVMQYYGDGTLSMFGSAIDAVEAAREIQLKLKENPKVPLRIGIHIGDVVYDDEGIYGDAVNIAARVQSLGTPGSVMISGKVFDEIKNHPGIRVEAFGEHELKNVFQQVSIFALADKGLEVPDQKHIQSITGSYENSVAVLPFANFSPDPDNEYLSDGITEEIINALTRVKGLEVASRTSVFAFKNTRKDIRQIAKGLNVATVLEGSIRRSGNKVRVTAQLIKADDGFHIWSENFDREMQDIFDLQDEIAQKIANKLEANLVLDETQKLYKASTDSTVAYNLYLQGLFYWNKRTPETVKKAIRFFEQAIEKCTTYTNAYSALANCYTFLAALGQIPGDKAFKKAEKYALKSVDLNSSRAESYTALGFVNLFFKWNFDEAEADFRKAITFEPDNIDARIGLGYYYRVVGNFDRMLHHNKAAAKIDPLYLPAKQELARAYSLVEDHEKALNLYDEILEFDPLFRGAYEGKTICYLQTNDFENARKSTAKYLELLKDPSKKGTHFGLIAAIEGNEKEVRRNLNVLRERREQNKEITLSLDFAMIYAAMDEYDKAFKYLNEGVDKRLGAILFIQSMFIFNKLKDDPRYEELLVRIGLRAGIMVA